jgi:hypothetical protein
MTNVYFIITTVFYGTMLFCSCMQEDANIRNRPVDEPSYAKQTNIFVRSTILERFPCPPGYSRKSNTEKTFAAWLETIPLKKEGAPVLLFNGELKSNQRIHAAVLDFDRGTSDLQQCADAVMRLRAEYLYQKHAYDSIAFTFTNGSKASYSKWREGYRPVVIGNSVAWTKSKSRDTSYACFRSYLNTVFMYCGTYSLSKELKPVDITEIAEGDVFIYGGFPGHAMIVMDVAVHETSGKKIMILAQSYMPAQDIHIVKNLSDTELSPWYEIPESGELITPEWSFAVKDLKRF